jgi:hypothetical protein
MAREPGRTTGGSYQGRTTHDIKEKATDQFERTAEKMATDQFKSAANLAEDIAKRVAEQRREAGEHVQEADESGNLMIAIDENIRERLTGSVNSGEVEIEAKLREAIALYLFILDENRKGNRLLLQRGSDRKLLHEVRLGPKAAKARTPPEQVTDSAARATPPQEDYERSRAN